jgi:hypothetical protein
MQAYQAKKEEGWQKRRGVAKKRRGVGKSHKVNRRQISAGRRKKEKEKEKRKERVRAVLHR